NDYTCPISFGNLLFTNIDNDTAFLTDDAQECIFVWSEVLNDASRQFACFEDEDRFHALPSPMVSLLPRLLRMSIRMRAASINIEWHRSHALYTFFIDRD